MSTLRRLTFGLLALGFIALPAVLAAPAAAEPTPTPAPPCKAGSLKLTVAGSIAVADAPDTFVPRSGSVQNSTGHYYSDLTLTLDVWPDQGAPNLAPKVRFTGTGGTTVAVTLRRVNTPHAGWRAVGLKPPRVWPNGIPSPFRVEMSFSASSPVTTYSTKLTTVAGVCDDTVLAASSGMRFGFMTSGPSPSAKPRASASAKPSRRPSPTPQASEEEVLPPPDETAPGESGDAVVDPNLAAGESDESGGSPLPWMAGLGVTALLVAGGLLFWLRRTSYDEDD